MIEVVAEFGEPIVAVTGPLLWVHVPIPGDAVFPAIAVDPGVEQIA